MRLSIYQKAYRDVLQKGSPQDRWRRVRKVAKILKLSSKACKRLEWMIFYETQGKNALKTSRYFGIAPKTFWKWKKRFQTENLQTLEEHSRAPKKRRQREISPLQEERIAKLRKEFIRYGKIKLALRYAQEYQEKISSWKIQKVIEKYQLYIIILPKIIEPNKKENVQRRKNVLQSFI